MFRGILSTIYVETNNKNGAKNIYNFLKKYHKDNFFIKVSKFNKPIGTGDVMNTNSCHISVCKNREKNKIIIISALDNLLKGGSGQAVQNMNVLFNIKETLGLIWENILFFLYFFLLFHAHQTKVFTGVAIILV